MPGVSAIEVNLERREAAVTFDDTKVDVTALTRATENVRVSICMHQEPLTEHTRRINDPPYALSFIRRA